MTDQTLLLVHAHPDDETISMGATMAQLAAAGTAVVLVTCTLGEEGEVVVEDLAHLISARDDALGEHRIGELAAAMRSLGVTDHRFLGGAGRWRDSGMIGTPENDNPGCFWRADLDEATAALVEIVREVRPQVLAGYDENGGYGHPDHIQAHRVMMAAYVAAADPSFAPELGAPWQVQKVYFGAIPKSVLNQAIAASKARGQDFLGVESADDLPFGIPDEQVTTVVHAEEFLPAKIAAMQCYVTQIARDNPLMLLAQDSPGSAFGREHYVLARGIGERQGDAPEPDLFAGVR